MCAVILHSLAPPLPPLSSSPVLLTLGVAVLEMSVAVLEVGVAVLEVGVAVLEVGVGVIGALPAAFTADTADTLMV